MTLSPLQQQLHNYLEKYSLTVAPPGEPFTLASGRKSMWYFVGRNTTFRGDAAPTVGKAILEAVNRIGDIEFDAIGGIVVGAVPVAMAVAIETGKPAFAVRKEAKDHGDSNLIAGPLSAGDRVLVVEDTVTTGGSTMRAIEAIEAASATVACVSCLLDRGGEFGAILDKKGIPFAPVLGAPDFGFDFGS